MNSNLTDNHDDIKSLLDRTWEPLSLDLEKRLLQIPTQVQPASISQDDKLVLVLNSLLVIWGLGLIYAFKDVIGHGMLGFSTQIMEFGSALPTVMVHPGFIVIGISILGITWLKFDLDFG